MAGQAETMSWISKGKVLIGMSSADYVALSNGKHQETGFFLRELGRPLIKLLQAGYDVTFANPSGETPHMDPLSDNKIWFPLKWSEKDNEKKLLEKLGTEGNFKNPRKFSSISDGELEQYDAILLPGGHAPMTDMWNDPDLGRILLHFHRRSKPTAVICHAPVALLSTKMAEPQGKWAYEGYRMTAYSDREEKLNEVMFGGKLPFKVEEALRSSGAKVEEALPMMPKVVVDRELISGQGPSSADGLGDKLVEILDTTQRATKAAA